VCCVLFERGVSFCVFLYVESCCSTTATGKNPFAVQLSNNNETYLRVVGWGYLWTRRIWLRIGLIELIEAETCLNRI
jgi:hypothetical protein